MQPHGVLVVVQHIVEDDPEVPPESSASFPK
jgi:hypothetical protein